MKEWDEKMGVPLYATRMRARLYAYNTGLQHVLKQDGHAVFQDSADPTLDLD